MCKQEQQHSFAFGARATKAPRHEEKRNYAAAPVKLLITIPMPIVLAQEF
jgi:hypothetical protein